MQFKIILVHVPVVLVQLPGTRSCGARVDVVLRPAYDARSTLLLLLRTWYCSATATLLSCRAFICTKGKCEKMLKPRMKAAPLPIAAVRVVGGRVLRLLGWGGSETGSCQLCFFRNRLFLVPGMSY